METMGERIKRLRVENNLTQEELGNIVGLKRAAINKYEKGYVENMKRTVIEKMASLFNVTPSYLMAMEEENTTTSNNLYNTLNENRKNKVDKFIKDQYEEQQREEQLAKFDKRTLQNLHLYAEKFGSDALDDLFEEMLADTNSDDDSINHEAG